MKEMFITGRACVCAALLAAAFGCGAPQVVVERAIEERRLNDLIVRQCGLPEFSRWIRESAHGFMKVGNRRYMVVSRDCVGECELCYELLDSTVPAARSSTFVIGGHAPASVASFYLCVAPADSGGVSIAVEPTESHVITGSRWAPAHHSGRKVFYQAVGQPTAELESVRVKLSSCAEEHM